MENRGGSARAGGFDQEHGVNQACVTFDSIDTTEVWNRIHTQGDSYLL